jgi:hypothetical protein
MRSLAIRGRSCTPASTAELTDWLHGRVEELRAEAPDVLIRLSRLAQDLPDATIDDGWLIELELPRDQSQADADSVRSLIKETLRDMRILGLSPTVLAPA